MMKMPANLQKERFSTERVAFHMKEYEYKDGKLATEESFERIKKFMQEEIMRVQKDPIAGREYLYGTGMHDQNGHLKPEFTK